MTPQEQLKAWRGERTLLAAAALIGCDPSTLSLIENEKRQPRLALALSIRTSTGIPVEAWVRKKVSGKRGRKAA